LQSSESLHTEWLHCQVYHVFSQILQTNTCHYLKLGHNHFVLQPYDSYCTSQSYHFLLYHLSKWQCCQVSHTQTYDYAFKYKITLFHICVSLTLITVTFLLKITIPSSWNFYLKFHFTQINVTLNGLGRLWMFYLLLYLRWSWDTYTLSSHSIPSFVTKGCWATKLRVILYLEPFIIRI
jgi:hypothetical protein